jgi:organic hydroperoxide reductase OsmC/OhrA
MSKQHNYSTIITWKGGQGKGTLDYKSYSRDHEITIRGKPALQGSSDQVFRGNPSKHTPEDMLVSSLASCHMLWYLHLCAVNSVVVISYTDEASGVMMENDDGSGQFTAVTLRPRVTVTERSMIPKAHSLHDDAHKMCFVARSVNFPVEHLPEIQAGMNGA